MRFLSIFWFILGVLVLGVSLYSVLEREIYGGVVADAISGAVFTQDLLAVLGAIVLMLLAIFGRKDDFRILFPALGILGFFMYAYGIYSFERVYNMLYPLYLMILSGSTFGLIYTVAKIPKKSTERITPPKVLSISAAFFGIITAIIFNFVWFYQLIPLLKEGYRIDYTYSIYVIDLAFIMPAFMLTSIGTLFRKKLAMLGLFALFVLGFFILSPLALVEFLRPGLDGNAPDIFFKWLYTGLSVLYLAFSWAFAAIRDR